MRSFTVLLSHLTYTNEQYWHCAAVAHNVCSNWPIHLLVDFQPHRTQNICQSSRDCAAAQHSRCAVVSSFLEPILLPEERGDAQGSASGNRSSEQRPVSAPICCRTPLTPTQGEAAPTFHRTGPSLLSPGSRSLGTHLAACTMHQFVSQNLQQMTCLESQLTIWSGGLMQRRHS